MSPLHSTVKRCCETVRASVWAHHPAHCGVDAGTHGSWYRGTRHRPAPRRHIGACFPVTRSTWRGSGDCQQELSEQMKSRTYQLFSHLGRQADNLSKSHTRVPQTQQECSLLFTEGAEHTSINTHTGMSQQLCPSPPRPRSNPDALRKVMRP